jgi:hypothetical protein
MGNTVRVNWHCEPEIQRLGQILGFVVCCTNGDYRQQCREKLRELGDDLLAERISDSNSGWLIPLEDGASILMAHVSYPNLNNGFAAISSCFRAPCRVEVWTVIRQEDGALLLCCGRNSGSSCYRKLILQYRLKEEELVEKHGFLKRSVNVSYSTTLTVSSTAQDAVYADGAVSYRLGQGRYAFPLAKETLGKPLRFPDVRQNQLSIEIDEEYRELYEVKPI